MALQALINSLDSVAESLRGEYVKGNGTAARPDADKFYLDVTPVGSVSLEDKSGLLQTIQDLRAVEKTLKGQLQGFDGLDAATARDALKQLEDIEANGGGDEKAMKAKLESLRTQLSDAFSEKERAWGQERNELDSELSRVLIDACVMRALDGKGSQALLTPIVRQSVRVVKDDTGKRVARVFDASGNELVSRRTENNGLPMDVTEFVESLRSDERYARAFDGSGPTGSGEPRTGSQTETQSKGGQIQDARTNPSSPAERLKAARAQVAGT